MAFQKVEFEFPKGGGEDDDDNVDIEIEGSSAEELDMDAPPKKPEGKKKAPKDDDDDDIDLEIVDDTPPEDRDRKPSPPPDDVSEDELRGYSEKVQERIRKFTKGYHDERRAKEAAERERFELEKLARTLVEENRKLKGNYGKSQSIMLDQAKATVKSEIEAAKRQYKEAYEAGNAEALTEAQDTLTEARIKSSRLENVRLPSLQDDEPPVQPQVSAPAQPRPQPIPRDERAEKWASENTWFGSDQEMTAMALAVHNVLVKEQGVDPKSDTYYERLNSRMRQKFPEAFEKPEGNGAKPKAAGSVVAPVTRTSKGSTKVRLSKTQVALANKLGVPLKEYARQVAMTGETDNG